MTPDTLTDLFTAMTAASWRAGWLIVLLFIVRRLVRGRIPAQLWYVAWILVAVRLLVPVSLPATWSPYNLAREAVPPAAMLMADASTSAPIAQAATPVTPPARESTTLPVLPLALRTATVPSASASWTSLAAVRAWGPWIWLAGVGLLAGWRLVVHMRFRRRLRDAVAPAGALFEIVQREVGALPGGASLACVETAAVDAPALYGLLRPRLLFPRGFGARLTEAELCLVVRHELAHWRRRDLIAQALLQAAAIVHWFNPLAWLASRAARMDCELACDEFVLRGEKDGGAIAYGETLLKVLGTLRGQRRPPAGVAILEGRAELTRRIGMIANYRKAKAGQLATGGVLMLALAIASMTRETQAEERAAPLEQTRATGPAATNPVPPLTGTANDPASTARVAGGSPRALLSLDHRIDTANAGLRFADNALIQARRELAAAEIRVNQMREHRKAGTLLNLGFIAGVPAVQALDQQLTSRNIEMRTLAVKYGNKHPEMVEVQNAISVISAELDRAMDRACRQVEVEYDGLLRTFAAAERDAADRTAEAAEIAQIALRSRQGANGVMRSPAPEMMAATLPSTRAPEATPSGPLAIASTGGDFSVSIVGAVNNQSGVNFSAGEKPIVLDAIARAGGFAANADRESVRILRIGSDGSRSTIGVGEQQLMSGLGPGASLQRGDVIIVRERAIVPTGYVTILGAVNRPGSLELPTPPAKLTLVDILGRAGGQTRMADLRKVTLSRLNPKTGDRQTTTHNVAQYLAGEVTEMADLQPGDIITIPERIL